MSNIAQNQHSISANLYPIVPALYPIQEKMEGGPQPCPMGDNKLDHSHEISLIGTICKLKERPVNNIKYQHFPTNIL